MNSETDGKPLDGQSCSFTTATRPRPSVAHAWSQPAGVASTTRSASRSPACMSLKRSPVGRTAEKRPYDSMLCIDRPLPRSIGSTCALSTHSGPKAGLASTAGGTTAALRILVPFPAAGWTTSSPRSTEATGSGCAALAARGSPHSHRSTVSIPSWCEHRLGSRCLVRVARPSVASAARRSLDRRSPDLLRRPSSKGGSFDRASAVPL